MKLLLTGLSLAAALALAACSADGDRADDPAGGPSRHGPMPTDPVAADGEVSTRLPATVMDTGRPELCLGAVAESYPPQCSGPRLQGWDWTAYDGHYDQQGDVRWGVFDVTGTWDGATFTVSSAEPGDGPFPTPSELPMPEERLPPEELGRIATEVRTLGGAISAYSDETRVLVDVPYDDGSLQDWVDQEYGDGVVVVNSALVEAGPM